MKELNISAEELVDHISTLGSIDANGYTSKSLSEIESQFENIDSIVSDLVDNGKLSVENMQKLLEEFPEMIKYLGEGKDLLEAMEELQKDQAELQFASIKNTIAENEENYTERLSKRDKFQYVKHSAENSMKQQRKYMELADDIRDKNLGVSVHTINNTGTTPEQTLELIMSMI